MVDGNFRRSCDRPRHQSPDFDCPISIARFTLASQSDGTMIAKPRPHSVAFRSCTPDKVGLIYLLNAKLSSANASELD
tara:strand:- start:14624 stop:14857 length:234 start_codon:yes stop_codon:yes gene_type:complete